MEVNQFDTLTRSLTGAGSRRRALALALGGLVTLGLVRSDDVAAGAKCKPKCPECKHCKKGKHGKKGKCKPQPNGTACSVGSCQNGSCAALTPQSPPPPPQSPPCGAGGPCRVFLSSATYDGNLGGLSGADAKCQGLATAAGLPGIYKAWLSDGTSAPSTRFVPSSGPYQLVTGTPIAANFTDLTDGTLLALNQGDGEGRRDRDHRLRLDEYQERRHQRQYHRALRELGHECSRRRWRTLVDALLSDFRWTEANSAVCSSFRHLYCFQQS